jgi:UDP-GlcNAc:undecaprenyl-phosphate GlcNAc-1-phosphate transferase
VLAFGTVALSLFDAFAVVWGIGIGLLIALIVSIVPRLRAR